MAAATPTLPPSSKSITFSATFIFYKLVIYLFLFLAFIRNFILNLVRKEKMKLGFGIKPNNLGLVRPLLLFLQ